MLHVIGPDEQIIRSRRREGTAAECGAGARGADRHIEGTYRVKSAVLENAHVGVVDRCGKNDGQGVRARGGARDILRVVHDLGARAGHDGGSRGDGVSVALSIRHRLHGAGGIGPADRDDVQIAGRLSTGIRHPDGGLSRLRSRGIALDEGDRRKRRRAGYRRGDA